MTGETPQPNALLKFWDSDSALQLELQKLAARFGRERLVKAAAKMGKGRRGRKALNDMPMLAADIAMDAMDWLDGKDPLEARSNYAIAKRFAQSNPGQSVPATHRRMMSKLAEHRKTLMLVRATEIARQDRPIVDLVRALDALFAHDKRYERYVTGELETIAGQLARYREQHGAPFPIDRDARELEMAVNESANALLTGLSTYRGMFGSKVTSGGKATLGATVFQAQGDEEKRT